MCSCYQGCSVFNLLPRPLSNLFKSLTLLHLAVVIDLKPCKTGYTL